MFEEDAPKPKPQRVAKPLLDGLSVDELRDYTEELRAEIGRVAADIDRKTRHRDAAEAFFRKA
jgi:uncharacterized small protein (DUF1192 family)